MCQNEAPNGPMKQPFSLYIYINKYIYICKMVSFGDQTDGNFETSPNDASPIQILTMLVGLACPWIEKNPWEQTCSIAFWNSGCIPVDLGKKYVSWCQNLWLKLEGNLMLPNWTHVLDHKFWVTYRGLTGKMLISVGSFAMWGVLSTSAFHPSGRKGCPGLFEPIWML